MFFLNIYYREIKLFVRNLFFVALVLCLGNFFGWLQSFFLIDQHLLITITLVILIIWLILIFEKDKEYFEKKYNNIFKIFFILAFLIIVFINNDNHPSMNWMIILKSFLFNYKFIWYLFSGFCGFFILYFFKKESNENQTISLESKYFNLLIVVIFGIAVFFRLPQITPIQTMHDVYAAKWITERILPISDSGVMYWRAFPFSYTLALFMKLDNIFHITNDLLIKFPVSFFSIISFIFLYYILKEIITSKRIIIWVMLLLAVSTWSITYAHYIRFFSMMMAAIYFSILCILYFIKSKKDYWLFLSVLSASIAFLIEKPSYLLLVIFFWFLIREWWNNNRKIDFKVIKIAIATIILIFMAGLAVVVSKPVLPQKFIQANEKIVAAKANIISQIRFDQYNVKVLDSWYPYIFLFIWPIILFLHSPKQIFKKKTIITIFVWSLLGLSFLGVSKNTPRNIGFFADIFPIILILSADYFSKAYKSRIIFYSIAILVFFGISNNVSFFVHAAKSNDFIPYGPARISNAKTFTNIHDMSLAADFVKQYIEKHPGTIIVSTHSAAWENYYTDPYKVDYILNETIADSLTTVNIGNDTYTLYEGLKIITLDEMLELGQHNNIILLTNYDFEYRLIDQSINYIKQLDPIYSAPEDERVNVYEFISPDQLYQ